jgi:hypothetical protein
MSKPIAVHATNGIAIGTSLVAFVSAASPFESKFTVASVLEPRSDRTAAPVYACAQQVASDAVGVMLCGTLATKYLRGHEVRSQASRESRFGKTKTYNETQGHLLDAILSPNHVWRRVRVLADVNLPLRR